MGRTDASGSAGAFYIAGSSSLHRMPAHRKMLGLLGFVVIVVSTPTSMPWAFLAYAGVISAAALVAGIAPITMARRMTVELPFLLFAFLMPWVAPGPRTQVLGFTVSQPGLDSAFNVIAKATLGVMASIVLAATTSPADLLGGLQRLRTPDLMVTIAAFMLRYSQVVSQEFERMAIARRSRCFEARGPKHWLILGRCAGALFIRSFERGERVHTAMLSRGFTGRMPQ